MGLLNAPDAPDGEDSAPLSSPARLSDVLFQTRSRSFSSLASLPCNVDAIDAGLLFVNRIEPFVSIVGPSGWGKSHLLDVMAGHLRQDYGPQVGRVAVREARAEGEEPLLLDDVQESLARPKARMELRLLLERRVRAGRPTALAFTADRPTRAIRAFLPQIREWRVCTMGEASPADRVALIERLAANEGLALSSHLVRILAHQMHGNGRTLVGALKRLRLGGPTWLEPQSTLRALGVLDPYFADNPRWDLRHRILRVAQDPAATGGAVHPQDLALYTMLFEAGLSEASVARNLDLPPADVYHRASRFRRSVDENAAMTATTLRFVERVAASLAERP